MTINGLALIIFGGASLLVGVICYAWGYWDGRDAERQARLRTWTRHGRVTGSERI